MVGAGIDHPTFDPNRILLNELTITGSFVYDADGFERALELLASGALPAERMIEPVDIPLARLNDVVADLAHGRIAGKVMVDPSLGSTATGNLSGSEDD
jgi:threonine dehydrogenase-like Zn-dependent dehydrogenase